MYVCHGNAIMLTYAFDTICVLILCPGIQTSHTRNLSGLGHTGIVRSPKDILYQGDSQISVYLKIKLSVGGNFRLEMNSMFEKETERLRELLLGKIIEPIKLQKC